MKIQVISEFAYPDNFRINNIIEELTSRGDEVDLLTGLPDYTTGYIPKEYRYFRNRNESALGAKIRHISTTQRRNGALWRSLNYFTFMINASLYALFQKKPDFDVILVNETSPVFQLLPGIVWKLRTKKKLIFYCYDLWPESMKAWGVGERNVIFRMVKQFCIWMYTKCDVIAITSEPFREYLVGECKVPTEKIVYLPQYAEDEYKDIVGIYEENSCVDFVFAGNIGSVQNVDCILNAIPYIKTDKKYMVHIVGDGSELENLKQLAKQLNIEGNITFHGRFPATEMNRFYKMADCFLLTLRGGDFIGKTLPAKVQGYLSTGKPITAAIDGAGYEVILQAECGEVVLAGDAKGLAQKMSHVIERHKEYQKKGILGRKFYEENFRKEKFMESFYEIIQ